MKNKINIITVIGARPQIIKAAAISREISKNFNNQINEIFHLIAIEFTSGV